MRRQTMKFYWCLVKTLFAVVIGTALAYPMFSISEQMSFDLPHENATMFANDTQIIGSKIISQEISPISTPELQNSSDYAEGLG